MRYGQKAVVDELSFALRRGEIACLLGPSGCGKTSVLRALAGFEPVWRGTVSLGGQVLSQPGKSLPPERRRMGMVFQDHALFPHLNVAQNVAFGLRGRPDADARVQAMLSLVGLDQAGRRFPHELSGGQQQRVALARALAPQPDVLLLDEPFSSLDVTLRERLADEVRDILKAAGTTAIVVTHDQHEAFAMADVIGVMSQGRLQQWDSADMLYHQPANRWVAGFVGQGTLVRATATGPRRLALGGLDLRLDGGEVPPPDAGPLRGVLNEGERFDVLLRPDDIVLDDTSALRATVRHKAFKGAEYLYTLELADGTPVQALQSSHQDHATGSQVGIRLDLRHWVAFAA